MTSFTFSAEQIKSAPPEARRWMENEIAKALGGQAHEHDPSRMQAGALAATTIDEAIQILNLISGNFVVAQVFFELARETPARARHPVAPWPQPRATCSDTCNSAMGVSSRNVSV